MTQQPTLCWSEISSAMEAARSGRLHRWNRAARTGAGIVCVLVLVRYVQRQLKWRQCVWETYLRWWDSPTADRLFAIYDTSGDDVIDLDVVPHMPIEYCRAAVTVLLALLEPITLTLYSRVAPHLHCSQHCTSGPMLHSQGSIEACALPLRIVCADPTPAGSARVGKLALLAALVGSGCAARCALDNAVAG